MALIASDRRTLIVGLGETGLACVRHCHGLGRSVSVVDSRNQPPALSRLEQAFPEVPVQTGAFDPDYFRGFDELIVSPGVSLEEPAIVAAAEAGVSISGDINLFREAANAPVVAITGSNGKSTVTTLVGLMAAEAGVNVAVGGNLGTPALELLSPDVELYVLELSSFQLEATTDLRPEVATVLNISDDHMDRYPDRMSYFRAKHRIFQGARHAVINLDDPLSQPLLNEGMVPHFFGAHRVDLDVFSTREDETGLWLTHGLDNLMHASELQSPAITTLPMPSRRWPSARQLDSPWSPCSRPRVISRGCRIVPRQYVFMRGSPGSTTPRPPTSVPPVLRSRAWRPARVGLC